MPGIPFTSAVYQVGPGADLNCKDWKTSYEAQTSMEATSKDQFSIGSNRNAQHKRHIVPAVSFIFSSISSASSSDERRVWLIVFSTSKRNPITSASMAVLTTVQTTLVDLLQRLLLLLLLLLLAHFQAVASIRVARCLLGSANLSRPRNLWMEKCISREFFYWTSAIYCMRLIWTFVCVFSFYYVWQ